MIFRHNRKPKRYVAAPLDWRFLGVKTGSVVDTQRDQPSNIPQNILDEFRFVTTYSNAKRIARWANRQEKKRIKRALG